MIVAKPCMNEFIAHLLNDSCYIQAKINKIIDMNRNFVTLLNSFLSIFFSSWKMEYDMKYILTQDKILFPMVHSQAI